MRPSYIAMSETLSVGSVESFLSISEAETLRVAMERFLAEAGTRAFDQDRPGSIHEVPGYPTAELRLAYEPRGRVEVTGIPREAECLLQAAFVRSRDAIRRVLPSVSACRPWTYVEYGEGQHITSHVDGIAPDPLSWPRQIAGISVIISRAEAGGAFYVETSSDDRLWRDLAPRRSGYSPGAVLAHEGADSASPWFRELSRTRWTVDPPCATALLYGSQVAHGTEPVIAGRSRKFVSWLIAEAPRSDRKERRP